MKKLQLFHVALIVYLPDRPSALPQVLRTDGTDVNHNSGVTVFGLVALIRFVAKKLYSTGIVAPAFSS